MSCCIHDRKVFGIRIAASIITTENNKVKTIRKSRNTFIMNEI